MTAMGVVAPGSVAVPHVLVRRNHCRSRYGILMKNGEEAGVEGNPVDAVDPDVRH